MSQSCQQNKHIKHTERCTCAVLSIPISDVQEELQTYIILQFMLFSFVFSEPESKPVHAKKGEVYLIKYYYLLRFHKHSYNNNNKCPLCTLRSRGQRGETQTSSPEER